LIAGLIPWLNNSVSRNICPSVIDITFVGINADTSPPCVSIIGRAVNEPPPCSSLSFAALQVIYYEDKYIAWVSFSPGGLSIKVTFVYKLQLLR